MVTFDGIIKNVGEFSGDLKLGRRNYERAKQGLGLIDKEVSALEETLKRETGFDLFNMPTGVETTVLDIGDVCFEIKTQSKIKRPQYKTVVTEMENYLMGISFLLSQGKTITGVVVEGRNQYVNVDKLVEAYEVMVAGVMKPELKHTIKYKISDKLKNEGITDIVLDQGRDNDYLNEINSANYVKMNLLRGVLASYVKSYEKSLSESDTQSDSKSDSKSEGNLLEDQDENSESVIAVTTKSAYSAKKSVAHGVDWGYVVKTLITVPTDRGQEEGELNILADADISKAEKDRELPFYKTIYREPRGIRTLYVSIKSVYDRIQELKVADIKTNRLSVKPKEIV
jgi:hypothetical protein